MFGKMVQRLVELGESFFGDISSGFSPEADCENQQGAVKDGSSPMNTGTFYRTYIFS
jgi:hypothetical protein